MKKTTIHDVAREAGVCAATVSRVINGDETVGAAYRKRVEEAIARLGYRPLLSARAIRGGRTGMLGMLMCRIDLDTFSRMVDGAMQEAARLGRSLVLMTSEGSSAVERERLQQMARLPIDGLIFRPVAHASALREARELTGVPVVGISMPSGDDRIPVFYSCAEESAYIAARYLLRIGRCRIAMTVSFREAKVSTYEELLRMAQQEPSQIGVQRYLGYRRAVEEAGGTFDPSLLLFYDYTREGGSGAAAALLSMDNPADALICANDEAALGALTFLREQGVSVPQRISLVGFDDSSICHAMSPTLTSVNCHSMETGRSAVRALEKLIAGQPVGPQDLATRASLVIRGSTCAPLQR